MKWEVREGDRAPAQHRVKTVESHRHSIMDKLELVNRLHLHAMFEIAIAHLAGGRSRVGNGSHPGDW